MAEKCNDIVRRVLEINFFPVFDHLIESSYKEKLRLFYAKSV